MATAGRGQLFKTVFTAVAWIFIAVTVLREVENWPAAVDWRQLVSVDRLGAALILVLCFTVATSLRALRWRHLLEGRFTASFSDFFLAFAWCFFAKTFTPFRAGEVLRPLWIKSQGGSASTAVGALLVERLVDVLILLSCVGLVVIVAGETASTFRVLGGLLLVAVAGAYVATTLLVRPLGRFFERRLSSRDRAGQRSSWRSLGAKLFNEFVQGLWMLGGWRSHLRLIASTAAIWAVTAVGFHVLLQTFFPGLPWLASLAVMAAVNLSFFLALLPGNLGMYEMAAVLALAWFGIAGPQAIVASVGLHGTVLVATILWGLLARLILFAQGKGFWTILVTDARRQ